MTLVNDGVNQLIAVRIHPFIAKENNHSRTKPKPAAELNNSAHVRAGITPGRACMGGGGGQVELTLTKIYTYTAPQKNSVLKGLLPTSTNTRTVYHKMSVYDFSFMIPFILYSLKELRLGLNCPMKLLPYGTQSITRNLGLYTYTKYFF